MVLGGMTPFGDRQAAAYALRSAELARLVGPAWRSPIWANFCIFIEFSVPTSIFFACTLADLFDLASAEDELDFLARFMIRFWLWRMQALFE